MGHTRTSSAQKYQCAHFICSYLILNNITRAVVTAREIALFHHLSAQSSRSISATLNFFYTNHIRKPCYGFYIVGTSPLRKFDYPHHYTVELFDKTRGPRILPQ